MRSHATAGTTFAFTDFLSRANQDNAAPIWTEGADSLPTTWAATKLTGDGNSGVLSAIKATPYSIGYVEFGHARDNATPEEVTLVTLMDGDW